MGRATGDEVRANGLEGCDTTEGNEEVRGRCDDAPV
jgi:hypothetical protein